MPTLEGFNGASLVPDLSAGLQRGVQGVMIGRQLNDQRRIDESLPAASGGDLDALSLIMRIDPQVGKAISGIVDRKDAKAAGEMNAVREARLREAAAFLQAPEGQGKQVILQMAQQLQGKGQDFSHLVEFMSLPEEQQQARARSLIALGAGMDQMLKPLLNPPAETSLIKNLKAAGIDPSSEKGKMLIERSLSKSATTVNVNNGSTQPTTFGADKEKFSEALATVHAKKFEKIMKDADGSAAKISSAREMLSILDSGFQTGLGAEMAQPFRKIGEAMGMDTDAPEFERFNQLAAPMIKGLRQPGEGTTSDADMKFMVQAAAGVGQSVEANRIAVNAYIKLLERKQEKSIRAEEWVSEKGNLDGFQKEWKTYVDANPLFTPADTSSETMSLEDRKNKYR